MTIEGVLNTHIEVFYGALLDQNFEALEALYAPDYQLIRSDGSLLTKTEVLADLRNGNLIFDGIEIFDSQVRIRGEVAILTGRSLVRGTLSRKHFETKFRLTAVYETHGDSLKLLHFQSTDLAL